MEDFQASGLVRQIFCPHIILKRGGWGKFGEDIKLLVRASSAVSVATKTKPTVKTYQVKKGDTLGSIAKVNKTTVAALVKLNGIKDPNKISVGQIIKLS